MSISSSFSNALSGLGATSRLAEVASNNLANALTKGYGRQSVDLSSASLGGRGVGVQVVGVTRATANDITSARRQADSDAATIEPQAEALLKLGRAYGEATDSDGLVVRVTNLENAMRLMSDTPESPARQQQVAEAAKDLADFMNNLSSEAAVIRQNADALIAGQVADVNGNLAQIDSLNAKIVRLQVGGRDVATLIDERARLIDEVNAMIPVRTHVQENGAVHLTTTEGLFVLAENPRDLTFVQSPLITTGMIYDPAGTGALSGLMLDGIDITPTSTHPQRLREGSIAGNFAVRDQIGVEFNARIDEFAADMIARFEDPAVDPTLAVGDPGLFTDNGAILDLTNIEGLAGRISLNALVDISAGGDATRLRDGLQSIAPGPITSDVIPRAYADALTAFRPAAAIPGLDGTLTASEMASGIAELTGVQRTNAETQLASLNTTRLAIANTEAEAIGVDTDTELQSLIQIEQSFAANIQVIQTASRMLEQILEIR
ncbi:MAG: flagellar hook-associated protein FlgK [Pseudomonadota bacterium]